VLAAKLHDERGETKRSMLLGTAQILVTHQHQEEEEAGNTAPSEGGGVAAS
jgi:hypothetical protein